MITGVKRFTRWVALAGGTILVGLVLLTVADVGLRYLFNAPIFGGQDLAKMGLLTVVATAIAYGGATDAHIAVDFLGRTSPKLTRWTDLLSKSISVVLLALLVWKSIDKGLDALQYGDNTIMLKIPFWPFYFILALGFALYALMMSR